MTDNKVTVSHLPDAADAFLAGVKQRADYSARYEFWENDDVPRLLEAVEAVLAIHRPQEVYALSVMASDTRNPPRVWCGHGYEETENDRHQMTDDDSIICLDKHEGAVCAECWEEGGEQVEWPCPTYRAITAALTGEASTDGN